MSNIIDITKVADKDLSLTSEQCKQTLQDALDYVELEGALNVMVIVVGQDNSVIDSWSNSNKPFTMVGALTVLQREFMDANIEGRE